MTSPLRKYMIDCAFEHCTRREGIAILVYANNPDITSDKAVAAADELIKALDRAAHGDFNKLEKDYPE